MTTADDIEKRAAAWLAQRDRGPWTPADQAALDAWLDAATAHRVAWLRLEAAWSRADRLAALRPGASVGAAPAAWPAPQRWVATARRMPFAAAIATTLLIAGGGLAVHVGNAPNRYTTEVGGRETVPLPDGSRVELNTATRLRADVDDKHRLVWLERGEAFFDVAPDPKRPFVVDAGARRITVLGTKFSVRREGGRIAVAVVEGKVRIDPVGTAAPKPAATAVTVTRGDIAIAAADAPATLVTRQSVPEVERRLSWRNGVLRFDQATLAEAAAEFNRYNRKKLVVTDPEAAKIRIGGSFEADNIDVFARLLAEGFGLHLEEQGEEIKISA